MYLLDPTAYLNAFHILSSDFRRTMEFVEPVNENLDVFSHRYFELLVRACTEFESLARDLLTSNGCKTPREKMKVRDYVGLEKELALHSVTVYLLVWHPIVPHLRPYRDWTTASPALEWYAAYNAVKHNRGEYFREANLRNTRNSLAAVFAILAVAGVLPRNAGFQERHSPVGVEYVYPGEIFSIGLPNGKFPPRLWS